MSDFNPTPAPGAAPTGAPGMRPPHRAVGVRVERGTAPRVRQGTGFARAAADRPIPMDRGGILGKDAPEAFPGDPPDDGARALRAGSPEEPR